MGNRYSRNKSIDTPCSRTNGSLPPHGCPPPYNLSGCCFSVPTLGRDPSYALLSFISPLPSSGLSLSRSLVHLPSSFSRDSCVFSVTLQRIYFSLLLSVLAFCTHDVSMVQPWTPISHCVLLNPQECSEKLFLALVRHSNFSPIAVAPFCRQSSCAVSCERLPLYLPHNTHLYMPFYTHTHTHTDLQLYKILMLLGQSLMFIRNSLSPLRIQFKCMPNAEARYNDYLWRELPPSNACPVCGSQPLGFGGRGTREIMINVL